MIIMSEKDCDCETCRRGIKCSKCGTRMEGGKFRKEKDGTEIREIKCPKCGERSMEVKVPLDIEKEAALFERESADFPELGVFNREKFR